MTAPFPGGPDGELAASWFLNGSNVVVHAAAFSAAAVVVLCVGRPAGDAPPRRTVAGAALIAGLVALLLFNVAGVPSAPLAAVASIIALVGLVRASAATSERTVDSAPAAPSGDALRAAEEERDRAQQRAESAQEARTRFLASMSHEMRTPMATVLGSAELLLEDESIGDDALEVVASIQRSAVDQLELISDVLELSRIEAGRVVLDRVPCEPRRICREAIELVRTGAGPRGLAIEFEAVGPEVQFQGDPVRVRQILVTLLEGALQSNTEGTVWISLDVTEHAGRALVSYRVEDPGGGMTEEQLATAFEAFDHAEAAIAARKGASGVGLAIARSFARRMEGDVEASSAPGEGTTFRFTLRADVVPEEGPVDLTGLRVLLAEDQLDLATVVRLQLRKVGAEVTHAPDGMAALEHARSDVEGFDVILLDIQMPRLDGLSTARTLRAEGWDGPIVAFTANAMLEDRDRCMAAGFDDFVAKPVGAEELRALVQRHGRGRRAPAAG